MKLISMIDFVLGQEKYWNYETTGLENSIRKYKDCVLQINNYAKFLKQPLKLEMFVPCDEKGNLLEELSSQDFRTKFNLDYYTDAWQNLYKYHCIKHKEATEKVLFEGFEFVDKEDLETFSILTNGIVLFNYDNKYKTFEIDRFYLETVEDLLGYKLELNTNTIKHIFG